MKIYACMPPISAPPIRQSRRSSASEGACHGGRQDADFLRYWLL